MTGENRQARDWDDTTPAEGFAYDVPPVATVARLISWFKDRACADEGMAIALDSQDLPVAAEANRRRAKAYRATVMCLEALRERCCEPETEFRGHLTAKSRPKAQVRAPP
ncbi:hypothetical protein [Methylobacterium radiotolerans]|uniref:hypothetical protein n=1 Tax=Methylobacterium radiotolerans TaxID=31998 RepID=UPI0015F68EE5|nr:hypothetical protein [Methylobacterium radiotolerans]